MSIKRIFKGPSARFRIALGLSGILVSLLLLAAIGGLVPDRNSAIRDGRGALAEAIAVNSSIFITRSDLTRMQASLTLVVQRNTDILSAAVRRADGKAVVVVGEHEPAWQPGAVRHSDNAQVAVPIYEAARQWGQVELRFRSLQPAGWLGQVYDPLFWLIGFISLSSLVIFYFYLGKMLKHLDPSQAIPERVRSALDTMAEGLLVLDARQNIVLANQAFSTLVGQSPDSMIGYQVSAFPWVSAEDQPLDAGSAPWSQTLADGEPRISSIIRLQLPDRKRHTFMVNSSPVLSDSRKAAGVLISFDDVTALEEKELELRLSKEAAEAANRSKSEFLANMSHEIRTPMNAILGFAEVLKRGYGSNHQESLKYLSTISTSGNHLLNLINDILDLSKIESGHLDIEKLPTPVHQIIREVIQIMGIKAGEKGIRLEYQPDGPLPERVNTDPGKVRQIITNLVGNAIKFTENGDVTIISRVVEKGDRSTLVIEVQDTGIGMSPEQSATVFKPFTQADSSITRRFGGTGLGLTISQRFAQALDGDIAVTSERGKGSLFTVTLGIGRISDVRMLSAEEIMSSRGQERSDQRRRWSFPASRVLVVDDGEENRELLNIVLTDLGLRVSVAENGQKALERVAEQSFDLVFMDVQMPVMDGYTAIRRMREEGHQFPVIALTAHAMKGVEEACIEAGYSGYMTKPIDIDQLTDRLAEELGGQAVTEDVADEDTGHREERLSEGAVQSGVADQGSDEDSAADAKITSRLSLNNPGFRNIVERFVVRLEDQLSAMEQVWQLRDYDQLATLGHWLKGSAGSVGFPQFTGMAQNLELFAREKNDRKIESVLTAIRQLYGRIEIAPYGNVESQTGAEAVVRRGAAKSYELPETLTSRLPDTHPKFRPIIERFLSRIAVQLEALDTAIRAEDFETIGSLAHWLKGSGGSVGFDAFTEPAIDMEMHARDRDIISVRHAAGVIVELNRRITLTEIKDAPGPSCQIG